MIGGRFVVRAALAGLLCLVLAGCSGDDDPVPPSSTAVTTTTADPIPSSVLPTTPVRPSDEATPESAEDFVRYFWQTYNYAYATYDTTLLATISAETCKACRILIDDVEDLKAAGTRISGHEISVLEAVSPPVKITKGTVVITTLRQQPGSAQTPGSTAAKLDGFKSGRSTIAVAWRAQSWHVEAISTDPSKSESWPD